MLSLGSWKSRESISNGLKLYLDASNFNSYPKSGTTWTNLASSNNNVTLINGPTFNANNNGYLIFDGVNDYANVLNYFTLGGKNKKLTVEILFFLPTNGGGPILGNERESNSNGHGWFRCNSTSISFQQHSRYDPPYLYELNASQAGINKLKINGWNYISWGLDIVLTSMSCNYLINGYTETITNNSLVFDAQYVNTEDNIEIGRWRNFVYGTTYSNFYYQNIRIYDRLLTISEQQQNYLSIKNRFTL